MDRSPFLVMIVAVLLTACACAQTKPSTEKPSAPPSPTQTIDPAKPGSTGLPQPPAADTREPDADEAARPKTVILDSSATSGGVMATDGHDPILDPPPLPEGKTTLVGGTVSSVDQVRDKMTVKVFGGGRWKIGFDERTHIFRNGAETTQLAIKKGERVSVDTMLDKSHHEVFARNIRLGIPESPADVEGQITEVNPEHRTLVLRDQIGASPVRFSVSGDTRIIHGTRTVSINDLRPGSLVHVQFSPDRPNRGLAREINIIAAPGSSFTFVGKITFLDMHRGLLALQNVTDDKNYEIHVNQIPADVKDGLAVGTEVRIVATFEGPKYTAQTIALTKPAE
jgi:hypothetical protein